MLVATNKFCRDKHDFVALKLLSCETYFCHDKPAFVATKHLFCLDKSMLVVTKPLSQTQFRRDKSFIAASILFLRQKTCDKTKKQNKNKNVFCPNKSMLVASRLLSRQLFFFIAPNIFSRQNFCRAKFNFIATKHLFYRDKIMLVVTKPLTQI